MKSSQMVDITSQSNMHSMHKVLKCEFNVFVHHTSSESLLVILIV